MPVTIFQVIGEQTLGVLDQLANLFVYVEWRQFDVRLPPLRARIVVHQFVVLLQDLAEAGEVQVLIVLQQHQTQVELREPQLDLVHFARLLAILGLAHQIVVEDVAKKVDVRRCVGQRELALAAALRRTLRERRAGRTFRILVQLLRGLRLDEVEFGLEVRKLSGCLGQFLGEERIDLGQLFLAETEELLVERLDVPYDLVLVGDCVCSKNR